MIPTLSELKKELKNAIDYCNEAGGGNRIDATAYERGYLEGQISIMKEVEPLLKEREEMYEFVKRCANPPERIGDFGCAGNASARSRMWDKRQNEARELLAKLDKEE